MKRILVAEDEPHLLLLIQRKLEAAGFEVLSTANGDDVLALALALDPAPDLVLLDIMLPGKDGLEVCEAVKSALGKSAPPVILISARGQHFDVEAGRAAGADDYIIKPFSPRALVERVQTALHT
jgi:DNA-binding response OmpR family regulator